MACSFKELRTVVQTDHLAEGEELDAFFTFFGEPCHDTVNRFGEGLVALKVCVGLGGEEFDIFAGELFRALLRRQDDVGGFGAESIQTPADGRVGGIAGNFLYNTIFIEDGGETAFGAPCLGMDRADGVDTVGVGTQDLVVVEALEFVFIVSQ